MQLAIPDRVDPTIHPCCPTCGGKLPEGVSWDDANGVFTAGGIALTFSRFQRQIISALWRARSKGGYPDTRSLADAVYRDDPDGGPETTKSLEVILSKLRTKLAVVGWGISGGGTSVRRQGFRLVELRRAA